MQCFILQDFMESLWHHRVSCSVVQLSPCPFAWSVTRYGFFLYGANNEGKVFADFHISKNLWTWAQNSGNSLHTPSLRGQNKITDLIKEAIWKGDAIFDGDDGNPPLLPAVLLVKLLDGATAGTVVRPALALFPAAQQVLGVELKLVVGGRRAPVHVHLPNLMKDFKHLIRCCFVHPVELVAGEDGAEPCRRGIPTPWQRRWSCSPRSAGPGAPQSPWRQCLMAGWSCMRCRDLADWGCCTRCPCGGPSSQQPANTTKSTLTFFGVSLTFISSSISFFHLPRETHLQCCHCWQRTGNLQQQSSHHSWNPPETNGSQLSGWWRTQVNNAFKTKKFKDLLVTTFQNWRWNPLKPTFVNHQESKKCKTTLYKKYWSYHSTS